LAVNDFDRQDLPDRLCWALPCGVRSADQQREVAMSLFDRFVGRMTEEQFAQRLIDQLRQVGDVRLARYDAAHFQIQFTQSDREVGYANLRNLYDEYLTHAGRDADQFFRFAIRSLLASHKPLPDEYGDAVCDILLTVRNRSYFSLLELRSWIASDPNYSWPHVPVGEHLGVGLTYDLPEAMVMLQSLHLADWGVSFYEVYEHALANLTEIDATFTTIDEHTYASATGDHYDASRMLLPELIEELRVVGQPVVLLPNRDHLLVTGSADRSGIETAALVARQLFNLPRPVTGLAFVRQQDEWRPWLPPRDHVSYATLKAMSLQTIGHDYHEQRQLLGLWLARRDAELEPAEFKVHGAAATQPPISYCVWEEGMRQLLPKTDRVCFQMANQSFQHPLVEAINCSWDHVRQVVGHLMVEEDWYPARYRVTEFPSPGQLSKLRRAVAH
jgi:hypothetical protein